MIPTSLRHLRSIGRRRETPAETFTYTFRVFFGAHGLQVATDELVALAKLGDDLSDIEWDWPRNGRRILVTRLYPLAIEGLRNIVESSPPLTFNPRSIVLDPAASTLPLRKLPRFVWDERDEVIREDA